MYLLLTLRSHAPITKSVPLVLALCLLTSCSTMTKSIVLSTGVGLATGALVGSAIGQNGDHEEQNRATFTGAAVGGAVGALVGYSAFKQQEKKAAALPPIKGFDKEPKLPSVTMPVVRKMWVPDKIEGNKFEAGHFIYILEKTSTWSQSNDK